MITNSPQETKKLGELFAKKLKGKETVCLIGPLGSGKTVFVKGIAQGLGIKEEIKSPSFVLMIPYRIKERKAISKNKIKCLVHVDGWRIKSGDELKAIGLEDYLEKEDTVVVIEWADRVKKILPKNSINIFFKRGKKENQRILRFYKLKPS